MREHSRLYIPRWMARLSGSRSATWAGLHTYTSPWVGGLRCENTDCGIETDSPDTKSRAGTGSGGPTTIITPWLGLYCTCRSRSQATTTPISPWPALYQWSSRQASDCLLHVHILIGPCRWTQSRPGQDRPGRSCCSSGISHVYRAFGTAGTVV